jgi:hypothetical protein
MKLDYFIDNDDTDKNAYLSLYLTNYALHHEDVFGSECICYIGTRWRLVASFRPCRFTPREGSSGTRWIGSWMDPRVCMDDMEK